LSASHFLPAITNVPNLPLPGSREFSGHYNVDGRHFFQIDFMGTQCAPFQVMLGELPEHKALCAQSICDCVFALTAIIR
jgi:hypothetical protein